MASKQGSIASFFKKPTPKPESKPRTTTKVETSTNLKEEQDDTTGNATGIIDLTDDTVDIQQSDTPRKRRRLSPTLNLKSEVETSFKSKIVDKSDYLNLNPSEEFTYPPKNHPSYPQPPTLTHNHPFPIPSPPQSLLSDLSFNPNPRIILKSELNLDLLYFNQFVDSGSRELYTYLLDALPWYRVTYVTKGFTVNTPRWTTVFGKDTTKDWGGYPTGVKPRAIPEILLRLMEIVEKVTGETYNFTLVNYYATGSDSISYHSDSESFLGPNPCIASLSLGSSRDFLLRHVNKNIKSDQKYILKDGDMVVMRGGTQANWMHSIPKRANAGGRLNLTFRKGVVRYATKNYGDYNVGKGPMYRWIKGEMVEQKG